MNPAFLILTGCFAALLVTHLLSEIYGKNRIRHITKPLLMPILTGIYISSADRPYTLIVCALLLGAVGDVFMMFSSIKKWFLAGAATFLVGHICYIVAFFSSARDLSGFNWIVLFLILPQSIILFGWCLPKILGKMGWMQMPLVFYGIVLFIMVSSTIFRSTDFTGTSFWLTYIGAVLFAFSDAMIVVDKFHEKIANAKVYIMLTYSLGQFLIVSGLIPS